MTEWESVPEGTTALERAMNRTILVPLDGSSLGERALALAADIARAGGATLKLVHVAPPGDRRAPAMPLAPERYLELQASHLRQAAGVAAEWAVLRGPVAETLAEVAATARADLVVMTTHGRGPVSRLWLGSVADRLARVTEAPLLLVRPGDGPPPDPRFPGAGFRRVLIALDGSPESEAAVAPAAALGRLFGADYTLLRVVEPLPLAPADGDPYTTSEYHTEVFNELLRRGEAQLDEVAGRLRAAGLAATTRQVVDDSPARVILEASKAADVTALATHGRGGAARLFLGSVADKVVRGGDGPVLLAHRRAG